MNTRSAEALRRLPPAAAIALGVLILDMLVEIGVAVSVLYILVIWVVYTAGTRRQVTVAAIACSFLTVAGLILSPTGGDPRYTAANGALGLIAIWVTAVLCQRVLLLMDEQTKRAESAEKTAAELEARRKEDKRKQQAMANMMEDLRIEREKLFASEHRFRATVESAPTAMVMGNSRGTIVLVNRRAVELFGYDIDEMLGEQMDMLVAESSRGDRGVFRVPFLDGSGSGEMGRVGDHFALRKDGTEFPVEIGLSPISTEEEVFVLGAIVDITERRLFEEAQQRHNEELEQRVEQRTRELAEANEALEESNIELQQFAYVASHDLQTPLRSISNFSQFLRKEYGGSLDEVADDYIRRIVRGCQRMQTLINDLLEFSRVESRGREFNLVDLGSVCDEAIVLEGELLDRCEGKVSRGDMPVVKGDATQLTQVFQNLIGNALKYRGEEPPLVEIRVTEEAQTWLVSVRDNGIGIEPQHHERIFELFRRLHTERQYPGTGIGLAVCRRIVTRHGGHIWLESELGIGSVFQFTLPRTKPERSETS